MFYISGYVIFKLNGDLCLINSQSKEATQSSFHVAHNVIFITVHCNKIGVCLKLSYHFFWCKLSIIFLLNQLDTNIVSIIYVNI